MNIQIKYLRKERKITQEKLSDIIGVARSTLAMWETNKAFPDIFALCKLSDYFNVSIDYLLGRSESSAVSVRDTQLNNRTKDELSDKFLEDYSQLLKDSSFIETTKLYNAISTEYRALCLGVLLGVLQQRGVDTSKILGY